MTKSTLRLDQQALADIAKLLHRYANHIDNGDLQAVAEMFQHGSIYDNQGKVLAEGAEQVLAMYSGMIRIYPDSGTPRTQHVVSNLFVESETVTEVRSCASFTVLQQLASGKIETIICGQYKNVFVKVDEQWAIKEHHMHPRIIGDMSEHLLIDLSQIK